MENRCETNLEELRHRLLLMAGYTESAVHDSVRAFIHRNADLAMAVRSRDDVIDQFEVEIDESAIAALTKAPLAESLRLVTAVMKISQNLERIGDEATKIARRTLELVTEPILRLDCEMPRMAQLAFSMVKGALDAFVERDATAARQIIPQDKAVDALNRQNHRQIAAYMTEHPEAVPQCLRWMVVIKSLERIADHAKNIAEDVVYACEGRDIRHASKTIAMSPARGAQHAVADRGSRPL